MTTDHWTKVKQIVGQALELDRGSRQAFVDRACGGDRGLRAVVETLLRADDPETPFLDLDRTATPGSRAPERLGPYRVVHEIGHGGMGTVYLAERDDGQFEQRVAIKVIKRGMDTDAVLRRFYAERQILARLQHPNITRLLDGGMFDERPYFVMEYLAGEPILEYCRRTEAPRQRRIELFLAVCDAVEYAHRNLILHRDLKAGNILVEPDGTPKLLDFGIAKLLEEEGSTEQTIAAARAMTPQAASPEQVKGDVLTTASDVYALGLLLYELLAGRPAYLVPSNSAEAMAHVVCVAPVRRPGVDPDLDNVILKAIEKEPARRYQRAADLADDLRRYLAGRPVLARAGGMGYRVRKFIGRHKGALAVAGVVSIALSAAVGDAILQGRRAERRFDALRQLAGTFIFEFHDAIADLPGATPARELVVKRALQYLDGLTREAGNDPALRRELAEGYLRVGAAQGLYFESNLGKTSDARVSFQKAIDLLDPIVNSRPTDLAARTALCRALLAMSSSSYANGPNAGSKADLLQRVIALMDDAAKRGPLDPPAQVALAQAWFGLSEGAIGQKKFDEAIQARFRCINILKEVVAKHPDYADALRWLATSQKRLAYIYITQTRDYAKGAEALNAALEIDRKRLRADPSSPTAKLDLAYDETYLSRLLRMKGEMESARDILESAIERRSEVLRADPNNVRVRDLLITDHARLGGILRDMGLRDEAKNTFEKGFQLAREGNPEAMKSPDAIATLEDLTREATTHSSTTPGRVGQRSQRR